MSDNWDGNTERRQDDTSVRFALLEKQAADNKAAILENGKSLIAVHKRISQSDHEQKAELRISTDAIMSEFKAHAEKEEENNKLLAYKVEETARLLAKKLEEHDKARALICSDHIGRMVKVENTLLWLDRWLTGLTVVYSALFGWVFHLQDKK